MLKPHEALALITRVLEIIAITTVSTADNNLPKLLRLLADELEQTDGTPS